MNDQYLVEEFEVGCVKVRIEIDPDPMNPRKEFDNVGTMVNWHTDYDLGDVNGRKEYGDGDDFIRSLAGDYTDRDVGEMEIDECWKIVHENYVILPLALYDHSGITMFVGSRGQYPFDGAGWDTSNIGYIYCSLKNAQHEWGIEAEKEKGWDGLAAYGTGPDDKRAYTLREATEKYLEGEVETYDQYLTGQVYGYIAEDPDGKEEGCWGYFGEIDYVREEARSVAESMDEAYRKLQVETQLALVFP